MAFSLPSLPPFVLPPLSPCVPLLSLARSHNLGPSAWTKPFSLGSFWNRSRKQFFRPIFVLKPQTEVPVEGYSGPGVKPSISSPFPRHPSCNTPSPFLSWIIQIKLPNAYILQETRELVPRQPFQAIFLLPTHFSSSTTRIQSGKGGWWRHCFSNHLVQISKLGQDRTHSLQFS